MALISAHIRLPVELGPSPAFSLAFCGSLPMAVLSTLLSSIASTHTIGHALSLSSDMGYLALVPMHKHHLGRVLASSTDPSFGVHPTPVAQPVAPPQL